MAKKTMYKCDRCNKFAWTTNDCIPESWNRLYDGTDEYHICPVCRTAFTQFITNIEVLPVLPESVPTGFGFTFGEGK
jgi:hypothetical protein